MPRINDKNNSSVNKPNSSASTTRAKESSASKTKKTDQFSTKESIKPNYFEQLSSLQEQLRTLDIGSGTTSRTVVESKRPKTISQTELKNELERIENDIEDGFGEPGDVTAYRVKNSGIFNDLSGLLNKMEKRIDSIIKHHKPLFPTKEICDYRSYLDRIDKSIKYCEDICGKDSVLSDTKNLYKRVYQQNQSIFDNVKREADGQISNIDQSMYEKKVISKSLKIDSKNALSHLNELRQKIKTSIEHAKVYFDEAKNHPDKATLKHMESFKNDISKRLSDFEKIRNKYMKNGQIFSGNSNHVEEMYRLYETIQSE
jgi:hypothetical protein